MPNQSQSNPQEKRQQNQSPSRDRQAERSPSRESEDSSTSRGQDM